MRAKPDGLTLMCGSLSPLATNMAFVKNMPYDPRKDFTAIAGSTLTNHVLVVSPGAPYKTFAEFLAFAKANPGKVSIGYSTSLVQLQIANIVKLAGVDILPVPYKGAPQSVTDVMGRGAHRHDGQSRADNRHGKGRTVACAWRHLPQAQFTDAGLASPVGNPARLRFPGVERLCRSSWHWNRPWSSG